MTVTRNMRPRAGRSTAAAGRRRAGRLGSNSEKLENHVLPKSLRPFETSFHSSCGNNGILVTVVQSVQWLCLTALVHGPRGPGDGLDDATTNPSQHCECGVSLGVFYRITSHRAERDHSFFHLKKLPTMPALALLLLSRLAGSDEEECVRIVL